MPEKAVPNALCKAKEETPWRPGEFPSTSEKGTFDFPWVFSQSLWSIVCLNTVDISHTPEGQVNNMLILHLVRFPNARRFNLILWRYFYCQISRPISMSINLKWSCKVVGLSERDDWLRGRNFLNPEQFWHLFWTIYADKFFFNQSSKESYNCKPSMLAVGCWPTRHAYYGSLINLADRNRLIESSVIPISPFYAMVNLIVHAD